MTPREITDIHRARAGLLRVAEPPAPALWTLIERLGPVAAWQRVRSGAAAGPETTARLHDRTADELEGRIDADFAAAGVVDARLIGPEDPEWPADALTALALAHSGRVSGAAPPLALWVRGEVLHDLPANGVTVVGSRANTAYGARVAADLAYAMAGAGWSVISGAAFGIDTAAHQAALATGEPAGTVAVLACGIDRAYPVANRELLERIAARGTVVSEYPPGTTPARHRFLVRNRLIAALGAGTVVIEAGRRSGTLSTAAAARALHRVVMAVPGPVTSALSVGCNLLIADRDAQLITGPRDVVRILRPTEYAGLFDLPWSRRAGNSPESAPYRTAEAVRRKDSAAIEATVLTGAPPSSGCTPVPRGSSTTDPVWGADAARVLDALSGRQGLDLTDLARSTGLPGVNVLAALAVLDIHGLARKDSTGWWRARTVKQPTASPTPT